MPVIGYRVLVWDENGVCQYEQDFMIADLPDAEIRAKHNAASLTTLVFDEPGYSSSVVPLIA